MVVSEGTNVRFNRFTLLLAAGKKLVVLHDNVGAKLAQSLNFRRRQTGSLMNSAGVTTCVTRSVCSGALCPQGSLCARHIEEN